MLASLIPFFLVARVAVDETAWKYGPEYIFNIEMNIMELTNPMHSDAVQRSNYTVMNMFCRPKSFDKLNCRLANAKRLSIDVTNNNQLDIPEEEMKHLYSEEPFDIKFNEYGIDYLLVNDQIPVGNLNDIKLIAERLSIGVDLNGIPDGVFEIFENSTVGQCSVTVGVHHYPSTKMMHKIKNPRYELESLPQLNKVPSEAIIIQKMTNLNNCSSYASFYFGSYGNNVVESDLQSHLANSISRIYVSDYQFDSSLTRNGTIGSEKMNNLVVISQHVGLTLSDIRAAKRELPELFDASKTTIMANADVDKFYPMK
nr:uncharacterized protein LOC117600106 [Osmia lignaria]